MCHLVLARSDFLNEVNWRPFDVGQRCEGGARIEMGDFVLDKVRIRGGRHHHRRRTAIELPDKMWAKSS